MNILVTGANGFLGSWLVRALAARGHEVARPLRPGSDVSGLVGLEYERVEGDVMEATGLVKRVSRGLRLELGGARGR